MRVHVDEPRRDDLTPGIDRARCIVVIQFAHRHNFAIANREVGQIPAIAGPIDDAAIADQYIGIVILNCVSNRIATAWRDRDRRASGEKCHRAKRVKQYSYSQHGKPI